MYLCKKSCCSNQAARWLTQRERKHWVLSQSACFALITDVANIEGPYDTGIQTAQFSDNWALSAGRATAIVRILTNDYGFDPHRITESGRGEFHPVKGNVIPLKDVLLIVELKLSCRPT